MYKRELDIAKFAADACVVGTGLLLVSVLVMIMSFSVWDGLSQIGTEFLLEAPRKGGRAGGIAPFIVSTTAVTAIAVAIAVPTGCGIAFLIGEYLAPNGIYRRLMRFMLAVLAAIPSIVFGLAGNVVFCEWLGLGYSILAGGLTLACMITPLIAFTTELTLRGIPRTLRASAFSLGFAKHKVLLRVVLPVAVPGIVSGVALAIGRAIAESAALIFTSGYSDRTPYSVLDSGRTLAVHILDLSMNVPGGDVRAQATAAVLMAWMIAVLMGLSAFRILLCRQMGQVRQ